MKYSRKTDYALQALLLLAESKTKGPLSVRTLAEEHGMPRKFLETIMSELRSQGLVESLAGKNGGYQLSLPPEQISLLRVIRCFDAPLLEIDPQAVQPLPEGETTILSPPPALAKVHRVLTGIGNQLDLLLESTSLADILTNQPIRYMITNQGEFAFGDGI